MRVNVGKLTALLLGQLHELRINLSGHLSALAENHAPHVVVHHHEAALALFHGEEVHQRDVLGILREWGHEWWIANARPYISHLVEKLYEQVVHGKLRLTLLLAQVVDGGAHATEVGHH